MNKLRNSSKSSENNSNKLKQIKWIKEIPKEKRKKKPFNLNSFNSSLKIEDDWDSEEVEAG